MLSLADGEEVSQFYFIVWGGSEKSFQCISLFVCNTGIEEFFTFKVPHELTGNLGICSERAMNHCI